MLLSALPAVALATAAVSWFLRCIAATRGRRRGRIDSGTGIVVDGFWPAPTAPAGRLGVGVATALVGAWCSRGAAAFTRVVVWSAPIGTSPIGVSVASVVGISPAVAGIVDVVVLVPVVVAGRVTNGWRAVVASIVTAAIPSIMRIRIAGREKRGREEKAKDEGEAKAKGFHGPTKPKKQRFFNLSFEPLCPNPRNRASGWRDAFR